MGGACQHAWAGQRLQGRLTMAILAPKASLPETLKLLLGVPGLQNVHNAKKVHLGALHNGSPNTTVVAVEYVLAASSFLLQ